MFQAYTPPLTDIVIIHIVYINETNPMLPPCNHFSYPNLNDIKIDTLDKVPDLSLYISDILEKSKVLRSGKGATNPKWQESAERSNQMFKEAGIVIEYYD